MNQTLKSMVFLTMLLVALATAAWGEQLTTQWAVSAGYPGTPSKVVADAQGNVYVTGSTYSADTNSATSTADMLTVKYDPKGVKLWEVTYNSPFNTGFDAGYNLVVDAAGNVYVAGTSFTSPAYYTNGCATVVKYSPAGQELWAARYADSSFGSHYGGLDVDAAGNVYIALSTIYDSAPNNTAVDGVVVKYDTNGNRVWKYLMDIGHYGDDWASKIMVKNGFVYAAGTFNGGDHGYGDNMRNSMVWKFTLDGQLVWTAIHDGGGADYASDFTVDGQDNVYIASMSDRLLTGYWNTDAYAYDFATAKFDANGQRVWNSRYNNTGAGNHHPTSIAVDAVGNVYVTGDSDGDGTTGKDLATVKYRGTDGAQLWVDRYNGTANGNEIGGTVQTGNNGDVYVSGTSVNSGTGQDYTTIKYGSDGTRKLVQLYNGAANGDDTLNSVSLDNLGNLLVTGASNDASGIPQILTIKYLQDSTPPVTTIAPAGNLNGSGVYNSNLTLKFTATDENSGVKQTLFSINGGSFSPVPANGEVVISDSGPLTVNYYSVDALDNQETVKSFTATINRLFYVRPDGLDTNGGFDNGAAGAFKTINYAVNQAKPGDVVEILEGIYPETVSVSQARGTATQPITVRGIGRVILDGQNSISSAITTGLQAEYVNFENLEIRNYTGLALYFHSHHNRFTNCDFHDNAQIAEGYADAAGFGDQQFKNCKFHNNYSTDGAMIRAYYAQGFTFEDCDFYDNRNPIVVWWAHTQDVSNIIRSRFYNNTGAATGTGDLIGTVNVFNSVFYNNGSALSTWDDRSGSVKVWKNNIVVKNGFGIGKSSADGGTVISDYNLVWGNTTNYDTSNLAIGAHDLSADPLFMNAAAGDFRLTASSPAVDKGVDVGLSFNNAAPDMGAYESRFLYVRPDGLDQNNGLTNTSTGAFKTIQHAVDLAQPGDVVAIQAGTYNEQVAVQNGGAADKHITVIGVGKVILDGQKQLGYAIITGNNASYVDFDNLEIRNYTVMATYFSSYDNRFTNCDFNNNIAVYEGWADYAYPYTGYGRQSFINCKFHDNIGPDYMIRAYFARGVTFDGCDFYSNKNSIVVWWAHSQDVNTIVRSRFYNNTGAATGTGDLIGTVNVFNSVFYNNGSALSTWDDRAGSVKVWKNNIVVNNTFGIGKSSADGGTVISDYNLVWGNTTNYDTSYLAIGAHDISADPLFTNAGAADFTLQPFSPALDKGTNLGFAFYGAAPDLGAVEKTHLSTKIALNGTLGLNGWYKSDVAAVISTDIPAATTEIRTSLNGAPVSSTAGSTATVNASQEGANILTFYTVDNTGSLEAANTRSFSIDKTAPATLAAASGTMGDNNKYRSNVLVTLTTSDATSGISRTEYSFNGTTWSSYSAPVTITTDGTTTISFRSVDKAGNTEAAKTLTVTIDKTAPTVTGTAPANNATGVATTASIVVTYSENIVAGSAYSSISLKKGSSTIVMTKTIAGNKLTIKPSSSLSRNSTYTVAIPVNGMKDTAGIGSGALNLSFTTVK